MSMVEGMIEWAIVLAIPVSLIVFFVVPALKSGADEARYYINNSRNDAFQKRCKDIITDAK